MHFSELLFYDARISVYNVLQTKTTAAVSPREVCVSLSNPVMNSYCCKQARTYEKNNQKRKNTSTLGADVTGFSQVLLSFSLAQQKGKATQDIHYIVPCYPVLYIS